MHFSLVAASALIATANAAVIDVTVGASGLRYSPDVITAAVGDQVRFMFTGSLHDVLQSTFDSPCSYMSGGFAAPPTSNSDTTYTINITDTNPIFFYCSVGIHCQNGMVGTINAPSNEANPNFASKAANANGGGAVSTLNGGVLVVGTSTVGSSATAASGSTTTTGASSTTTSNNVAGSFVTPGAVVLAAAGIAAALI